MSTRAGLAGHAPTFSGVDGFPRSLDMALATLGLVLGSPLLLLIALAIKLGDGGPVFFRQDRVGKDGETFQILKFRTMVTGAERGGGLTVGDRDPRITTVGAWLRRAKLDELPQLWNVLRGDMKFVGPRPELPEYVSLYNEIQRVVLSVPPGITDPASIAFRDESRLLELSHDPQRAYVEDILPRKLAMNVDYLLARNLRTDLGIIGETVRKAVLKV